MSRAAEQAREFRKFVEQERLNEDREQYRLYTEQFDREQEGVPKVRRAEPVSFDVWRSAIPEEMRKSDNAILRGLVASTNSSFRQLNTIAVDRLQSAELSNEELEFLGFDPNDRFISAEAELSVPAIRLAFDEFKATEPRYSFREHYGTVTDFLYRNRLFPSIRHLALVFNHLFDLHLLPEPQEPEPEQETRIEDAVDPDPETQRAKRRQDYYSKPVIEFAGKKYTEADLDRMSSEEYARVAGVPRVSGWIEPTITL